MGTSCLTYKPTWGPLPFSPLLWDLPCAPLPLILHTLPTVTSLPLMLVTLAMLPLTSAMLVCMPLLLPLLPLRSSLLRLSPPLLRSLPQLSTTPPMFCSCCPRCPRCCPCCGYRPRCPVWSPAHRPARSPGACPEARFHPHHPPCDQPRPRRRSLR